MLIALVAFFSFSTLHAQEQKNGLTWYTDLNKAYEQSASTHKPIFGFFTGSDWCGWCHKLEKDVFAKAEFKTWAAENVILLELDFPRSKQLPQEIANQNNNLQQYFKVQGYPTIWLFNMDKDASGKYNMFPMGSLGYPQSARGKEAATFLSNANTIMKNNAKKG
jgi:protein disulfide-isomerase